MEFDSTSELIRANEYGNSIKLERDDVLAILIKLERDYELRIIESINKRKFLYLSKRSLLK